MIRTHLRSALLIACCAIAAALPLGSAAQEPPEPHRSMSYEQAVLQAQGQVFHERVADALCDAAADAARWYERAELQAQGQSLVNVAAAACDVTLA